MLQRQQRILQRARCISTSSSRCKNSLSNFNFFTSNETQRRNQYKGLKSIFTPSGHYKITASKNPLRFLSTNNNNDNKEIGEEFVDNDGYDGGDEEEYILQHVPSSTNDASTSSNNNVPYDSLSSSSPMEKILEAWADTVTQHPFSNTNIASMQTMQKNVDTSAGALSTTTTITTATARETAIQQTLSWFNQMTNQQMKQNTKHPQQSFGSNHPKITTSTYNVVLKMLAETAVNAPSIFIENNNDKDETETVEQAATRILEQMKSSNLSHSQPNIETYNTYIACLRRSTPKETSSAAEIILNSILSEANAPEANVETYNAVLMWHAMYTEVDNIVDMSKMEELYQGMIQMNINPNYRTFQIMLYACTKKVCSTHDFKFDPFTSSTDQKPHQAQLWIERMTEILGADSIDDDIWNLTIPFFPSKFYPSPLMTTKNNSTSLYSRCKAEWDERERMLFSNETDALQRLDQLNTSYKLVSLADPEAERKIEMAQKLEEWVEYIMATSTANDHQQSEVENGEPQSYPTITAVNAIILAWVQTCTKEGLLKAESWALKALEFPHLEKEGVHVNTFLPILIGWAMCEEEYGIRRVEEWIDKFEELSTAYEEEKLSHIKHSNNHQIKPNAHVLGAAILGWKMHQILLLKGDKKENKDAIFYAANQSTRWLEKLCALDTGEDLSIKPLDGSVFAHVIDTWYNISWTPKLHGQNADMLTINDTVTENVLRVVRLMNSKIVMNHDEHPPLFNLLPTFHKVYGHAIRTLGFSKKLGRDQLQINSRFTEIQQMLYIADILYPHLTERLQNSFPYNTSQSDFNKLTDELNAFSHHMFVRDLKEDLAIPANIPRKHTYDFFYSCLLKFSMSLKGTISQGLRVKMFCGIIDRLAMPTSPICEHESDTGVIWINMINNLEKFTVTFEERRAFMDKLLEYGLMKCKDPVTILDLVDKTMRRPYIVDPDKGSLEQWIEQKKDYWKQIIDNSDMN